jgi:hypothetical protein
MAGLVRCLAYLLTGVNSVDQALHDEIIQKLARQVDEDDLILAVCEKQQVGWNEAKALIEEIKAEHGETILVRQMPVKILIASATLVFGLILVSLTVMFTVDLLTLVSRSIASGGIEMGDTSLNVNTSATLLQVVMQNSPYVVPAIAALLINGLGMVFGSLLGMREAWDWLIDKVSVLLFQK